MHNEVLNFQSLFSLFYLHKSSFYIKEKLTKREFEIWICFFLFKPAKWAKLDLSWAKENTISFLFSLQFYYLNINKNNPHYQSFWKWLKKNLKTTHTFLSICLWNASFSEALQCATHDECPIYTSNTTLLITF